MISCRSSRNPQGFIARVVPVRSNTYAPYGIRANSISPAPMLTDMSKRLAAGNPDVFKNLCSHIMLNRMGEPDELNGAAVFLLSDASSFVTAEDILVDGGQGHL